VEGADGRRWVLLDYGDVVVHVFHVEERSYYRIERLYGDAPRVDWHPPGHPEVSPDPAADAG
jgi:ribosome-associated protein